MAEKLLHTFSLSFSFSVNCFIENQEGRDDPPVKTLGRRGRMFLFA
jgi:hypothetical protein